MMPSIPLHQENLLETDELLDWYELHKKGSETPPGEMSPDLYERPKN